MAGICNSQMESQDRADESDFSSSGNTASSLNAFSPHHYRNTTALLLSSPKFLMLRGLLAAEAV